MKKIIISLLLAAMMISLAGCGSGSTLSANDPVELTMWHVYGEQADSPMDDLVDEFNRTVGRDKGISVRVTGMSSSARIGELLLETQAGGKSSEMPDLFTSYLNDALALGEDNLVDWNEYFTEEQLDEFVPGYVDDGMADGKLFVFPFVKSTRVLMINGSAFDRFSAATGVTYDDLRTWDGFYAAAQKFYDWSGGEVFCCVDYPLPTVELEAMELGGDDYRLFLDGGRYNYDDPYLKQSWMQFARALVNGYVQIADLYSNTQMMTGETLCGLGSSAAILYFNDTVYYPDGTSEPMDLHVLPMPEVEGGNKLMAQNGGGIAAYKTTEKKAAAAAVFVDWLTQPERNMDFAAGAGYMPARKGAFDKIDIESYDFPNESYVSLYESMRQMQESCTAVTQPYDEAYYERIDKFYAYLHASQSKLHSRAAAGEDTEALAEETWNYLKSLG